MQWHLGDRHACRKPMLFQRSGWPACLSIRFCPAMLLRLMYKNFNMRKSRLILCPNCDEEQRVNLGVVKVKCKRCEKTFKVDAEKPKHPHHFWHNPDTSGDF